MTMRKRRLAPIVNDAVTLRLLEEGDLPMTRGWRNRDDSRRWFLTSSIITPEQHAAWFAQYRDRDDDFVFVIEDTAGLMRPIGQVSIYAIDWDHKRAKFGRLLIGDPAARGKGLARKAVDALVAHAFNELGLAELRLEVLADNARAIALYQSCGFATHDVEGREIRMVKRR